MNEKLLPALAICIALTATSCPRNATAEPVSAAQAVNEALDNNPNLRAAVSQLSAAQGLSLSESARYDAALTLSLGATHTKNPSLSPGTSSVLVGSNDVAQADATLQKTLPTGAQLSASVGLSASRSSSPYVISSGQGATEPLVLVTGPGYLVSTRLGVTQPLLRGAGAEVTLAPYRQAVVQQTASERERSRTASALAREVLVGYWELWYASQAVDVDLKARQTARAQRDDARLRAQTGSLASADVLTFETQLATKEESLLQSELERTTRQNDLGRLLGRDSGGDEIEVSEPVPSAPRELPAELLALAVHRSPDVSVTEANLTVAQVQQRTAADGYRKRLDLDAYVQSQGLGNKDAPSAFSQFSGLGVLSAHVGLTMELPLSGTRYEGQARRASATVDAAHENLVTARNQVAADMATLVRKRELARKRIDLSTTGIEFAEQQLAAKRALFVTGSATALEVTQAQDNVPAANKRLARARADLVLADLVIAYHLDTLLTGRIASRSPSRAW